jgi:DNA-cytosine methyltransferase
MTADVKIKVGSDCSGWASEVHALRLLGLGGKIDHQFACDISKASKTIIFNNCRPKVWYDDCLTRDSSKTPYVDVYVAGFPCQPFSTAGKNLGMHDDRATVFDGVFDYIKNQRPAIFILENVKNLMSTKHHDAFNHIIDCLESIAEYWLHWKIFNSKDYGVPQNRQRLYIVGIKLSAINKASRLKTRFCELLGSCVRPVPNIRHYLGLSKLDSSTVTTIINSDLRSKRLPMTAKRNLQKAMQEIKAASLDPSTSDIVVDLGHGRANVNMMHKVCPTITKARGGRADFYLISTACRLSILDMVRLQGLEPHRLQLDGVSSPEVGQLAGNAMTIPVLAAILRATLIITGLAHDID